MKSNKKIISFYSIFLISLFLEHVFAKDIFTRKEKDFLFNLSDGVNLEMIYISPGTFEMGSPEDELGHVSYEALHSVTLTKEYWIGKYEVTQAQWKSVMTSNPSRFKGDNLPVDSITWFDADKFCKLLTQKEKDSGNLPKGYFFSLPTEAQWEYACRADTKTSLNNGENVTLRKFGMGSCPHLKKVGWSPKNSKDKTHPVGLKLPNAWGVYDMHGNVSEWCSDWFSTEYYSTNKMNVDPMGPTIIPGTPGSGCLGRVLRGGSYASISVTDKELDCRSAARTQCIPEWPANSVGFRLALFYFDTEEDIPGSSSK